MNKMTAGERIQYLLDQKEISQKEFAKKLNIAPTTLSGYIRDKREPDFVTLKRIAISLQTSVDYLLGLPSPPRTESNLHPNEQEFIRLYRELSIDQQELLLEQARLMTRQNQQHSHELFEYEEECQLQKIK